MQRLRIFGTPRIRILFLSLSCVVHGRERSIRQAWPDDSATTLSEGLLSPDLLQSCGDYLARPSIALASLFLRPVTVSAFASPGALMRRRLLVGSCVRMQPRIREKSIVMQSAMERFTERAVRAVMAAQTEAKRLRQAEAGVEVLLIGVLGCMGTESEVLKNAGVTEESVKKIVEEMLKQSELLEEASSTQKKFTAAAETALKNCVDEAPKTGGIDTIHILFALLKDETIQDIFERLKVKPEEIKKALQQQGEKEERKTMGSGGSQKKESALEEFGKDLTKMAMDGELDPVVGRDEEIARIIEILAKRTKKNPVLIGEPGVGKTAIAEGLAMRVANGSVHESFAESKIISIDLGMVLAGTKYRGDFEERMKKIVKEAQEEDVILMIDEIHTLVGAGGGGSGGGAMDAANILKPGLARGDLRIIGATTIEEYRKYIEKDKALERRLTPVTVREPTIDETLSILRGTAYRDEVFHEVNFTDEALVACAKLAAQYIPDRFLPDKAIDVRDETAAKVKLRASAAEEAGNESSSEVVIVSEKDVEEVVAKRSGIPVKKVSVDESVRLLELEETLHKRVIGQDEAVEAVAKAVRRSRSGLKSEKRPIASFIFSGPTGVGKTELCKALAAAYFGSEDAMIRLDMSEFMERHTVSKLIGSPPGFVGYDDESMLTDAIRRRPYSLVLFDEIEKAHPDIFNIMLQILEDGRLTDSKGRVLSFNNALIIMTSNVGAESIQKGITGGGELGFSIAADDDGDVSYQRLKTLAIENLKSYFRPEFLNRLDDYIVFKSLTQAEVTEIADLEFAKVLERCKEQHSITVELTDKFKEKVLADSYDPVYGARPLRRTIMRMLEDQLAESFLRVEPKEGENVICDTDESGEILIKRPEAPAESEAAEAEADAVEETAR